MEGQEGKAHAAFIAFNSNSLADYRGPREVRGLGRKQYLKAKSQRGSNWLPMDMEANSPGLSGIPGGDRLTSSLVKGCLNFGERRGCIMVARTGI